MLWLVPKSGIVITSFFSSLLQIIIPLISMFFITTLLIGLFFLFKNGFDTNTITEQNPINEKEESTTTVNQNGDSLIVHHRVWQDFNSNIYEADIVVKRHDLKDTRYQTSNLRIPVNSNPWPTLYKKLEQIDAGKLDSIVNQLKTIQKKNNLNRKQFLEVIGTFIQDIKYALILSGSCKITANSESSITDVLKKCPECCVGNIPYGVHSPVQFLASLKGDCDTRTVLAHYILKKLNYDVVILNSNLYLHSMLGVNIPYLGGKFKSHLGKRYYFWELTNKGFKPGNLPAQVGNINKWNVQIN
jgi:hypothetical protein